MRRFPYLACLLLIEGCAPASQSGIFVDNKQKMAQIRDFCIESTVKEKAPNRAAVDCRFAGYENLLRNAGFKDTTLLEKLHYDYGDIADKLDAKKINEGKADKLFIQANNEFHSDIQRNDTIRMHNYVRMMADISQSLSQTSANINAINAQKMNTVNTLSQPPSYQSQPAVAGQTWSDAVDSGIQGGSPAPLGIGQGARGWDGRTYIPVDPALTPGLTPDGYAK